MDSPKNWLIKENGLVHEFSTIKAVLSINITNKKFENNIYYRKRQIYTVWREQKPK